ncbi:MAG: extracellular solute-binding protein [Chloroflexota bacterium]|nr:extracellular solute-binding protein [Chloroflexota bacterium]
MAAPDGPSRQRLTRRAVARWAAPFALVSTVAGAAAGCLPSGAAPSGPGPGSAPEVQLRYLAWLKEWGETVPQLASRLREQHRVVLDVELAAVGVTPWQEKLQALFAADAAPDALQGRANVDPLFQDGGLFLDLASRVQRDKVKIDAATYALSGTERWCGKIYSVPHWADPNAVFYNKSLLRQVGAKDPWDDLKGDWTLAQYVELARTATRDRDGDGRPDSWGIQWTYNHPSHVGMLAWTLGGDVADFQAQRYTLDSPTSIEAHRQLQEWLTRDRVLLPLAEADAIRKETGLEPFQAGRVAFQVRAVTDVVRNLKAIGNSFEWDVIHLPRAADGKPGLALAAGHGQVAAARTAHPDRAWDALKFLIAPEAQEVWAQVNMPALRSAFGAHLKAPPAHVQVFGDLYARGYGIHFRHHNTAQAWDLYADEGRKVIEGQASLGPGLTELNRRMNDLVRFGSCAPYAGLRHPIRP